MKIFPRECCIMPYYPGENQLKPFSNLIERDLEWTNVFYTHDCYIQFMTLFEEISCTVHTQCKRKFSILKAIEFVIFENDRKCKINKKLCHVCTLLMYNTVIVLHVTTIYMQSN